MIKVAVATLALVIAVPAAAQPAQAPHQGHGGHDGHGAGAPHQGHGQHQAPARHQGQPGGAAGHSCACCRPGQPPMACCGEGRAAPTVPTRGQ